MHYEYTIYAPGSTEETIFNFSPDAPLTHIAPGNSLLLSAGGRALAPGHHLLVRHVETYVYAPIEEGAAVKSHVHVFTAEFDRLALKESVAAR